MKKITTFLFVGLLAFSHLLYSQTKEEIIESIIEEATENSQLEQLAFELLDEIGPRLVGTPQMKKAHDWAVAKFAKWGITAENRQYGEWRGWERGVSHIDMLKPRVKSIEGMQLAWSPASPKKGITAEVVILPTNITDSVSFARWLPSVKGKIVLISQPQITGRPDYNWEEFATEASFEKMKEERTAQNEAWNANIRKSGYSPWNIHDPLEKAGALALVQSYWSRGFGANKIFSARTKNIPVVDISLEDYGTLYRLAENGKKPEIRIYTESKELGVVPTFNTIATIPGIEKPNEYILLSAHFDSWDGGTGATDNGTGSITMMEIARILKKVYPNPKRTIIVGLWGSEEQGLNGSRAFVTDHPEIVENIQVVFNQDNGTGRVVDINGQGFLHAYDFLGRWMEAVPDEIKNEIKTTFPGTPSGGGSDHSSFVAAGAPAFMMSSLNWSYWNYTWHTNRDTYDKIVFDDIRSNTILMAIMTYMASEDPERTNREQRVLPLSRRTGEQMQWPAVRDGNRRGGLD